VTNCLGRAVVAALMTIGAASAHAQITTVIAPSPKRNQPSQQEVARREQATQDSVARVTLTGMTEWVDSAAASLAIRPDTAGAARSADSAVVQQPARATTDSSKVAQAAKGEVDLRNGARAPNTATSIPTIGLVGTVLIMLGVGLRVVPRTANSRARP
jgi:hypothetical protein